MRPDFASLQGEAEQLARDAVSGDTSAVRLLERFGESDPREALARWYGLASWARLEISCALIDAIWSGDVDGVAGVLDARPGLLHEHVRGQTDNWGPPLSYAANVGDLSLIALCIARGARDLQHAFGRACLQGHTDCARFLHAQGARPAAGEVMGPAETLNPDGLALLIELGAEVADERGHALGPIALVLETYARNPEGKHACLELLEAQGLALPDTPPMAVHRGRRDLLERHVAADPAVLTRTFSHEEVWPRALGCHSDRSLALHGTPIAGGTLLHLCVDYDELELAVWLLERGAPVDQPAAVDDEGFGGHTALFGCAVSQPYRVGCRRDLAFASFLLEAGADPLHRASLRKRLRFVADQTEHRYRNVTAWEWGQRFHEQAWVHPEVLTLLAERGGGPAK
ncbi:MAG: ankyrin repeat domain-containing protein [Planctomycetota bacterium]|nr:ankyrin repeat domain-containing protein [Planctomycetota bacterium]